MGRMKELLMLHVDRMAWEKYQDEFYNLTKAQQDEVWKLGEQSANDYLTGLTDANITPSLIIKRRIMPKKPTEEQTLIKKVTQRIVNGEFKRRK